MMQKFAFTAVIVGMVIQAIAAPVHLVDEVPLKIRQEKPGLFLVDFGRVAFGNLRLMPSAGAPQEIVVHFGEALDQNQIDRTPPGSVRYSSVKLVVEGGKEVVVAPAPDARNSRKSKAILTPPEWGVITPFRWVEIEGWSGDLTKDQICRQSAFASAWDDEASEFKSSDELLNRIWNLCKYSIKATTFAGVFVDGDRERVPYEGDAYLNQLGYYNNVRDLQMPRETFDYLMKNGTWPTEWASHMIFIAYADYQRTGDLEWLAPRYEKLKSKLLSKQAREDGLIVSTKDQMKKGDLVDWPSGERDGFVFTPVNTVINAFHLRTLRLMGEMARALKKDQEASEYAAAELKARIAFQSVLFDSKRGLYRDGEGTDHSSQHANLFPLAFDLVPPEDRAKVVAWVAQRGMRCSVYAAQYLLEGLWMNDADKEALGLVTASNDRSWRHMVESGTTITWEAWDQKYKPNQDWNHAWGAAPANLFPRFILGVEPVTPGGALFSIRPHPGSLTSAEGKVPTHRGPILIQWTKGETFVLTVTLPEGVYAQMELPATPESKTVTQNGQPVAARREGARWIVEKTVTGTAAFEVR